MITDEMVEAAAQAIWTNCPFDLLDRPSEHHRDYARAALAAVLPMVVAKCAGVAQERVRINNRTMRWDYHLTKYKGGTLLEY